MLLLILSVLGHPAMLFFHALHWAVEGYPEAVVVEMFRGVLPESGRAQMDLLFSETPERTVLSFPDGIPNATSRRLAEEEIAWAFVILTWIGEVVFLVLISYVLAVNYRMGITDKRVQWQGCPANAGLQATGGVWKYGLCDCFQNCDYCLYGFFCNGCRIGDTYTATGVGPSYMTYIHAFVAVEVVGAIVQLLYAIAGYIIGVDLSRVRMGYWVSNLFLAIWLAGQRKKLRQQLGDPSPDSHCAMDFLLYWCCGCCTAVQEGRQVDEITNTRTTCCFDLRPLQVDTSATGLTPAAVGQPAAAWGAPATPVVGAVVAEPKQEPSGYGGGDYGNIQK
jgi:Cys-rich protein (TIGR01571 family)